MENSEIIKKPDLGIFNRRFPARLESDPIYDPTKMTILTGSDGILDDLFSYQVYNKIKNHWRAAAVPADIQPGMIWSDSDDDKLYHHGAADEEILQLTRSSDVGPQFSDVKLMDTGNDHYLKLQSNEDLSANRTLSFVVNDAVRTLTLQGSPTLGDWFDQAVKVASSPIFADVYLTNALFLRDTGNDHYLKLQSNEDLTANKTLNFVVGDAVRTITLSGSPTLGNWFDQSVKQAAAVVFGGATINGKFSLGASTELTIAGGAITVTRSYHTVDGQGDAADNLDTINGGVDGQILVLRQENIARAITVRDNIDNIELEGSVNMVLDALLKKLYLFYDGALTTWVEFSRFNGV